MLCFPAVLIQKNSSVMAYFYCDYKDQKKQDPSTIIRSLIRQFARQNDTCFEKLEEFYEAHTSEEKESIPTQSDLIALLHSTTEDLKDAIIMIDALDECLDDRAMVTKLLRDLNVPGTTRIKTLFTSRDEADIKAQLDGYTTVSMAENSSDIARYVDSELKIKDWAKELSTKEKDAIKEALIEPAAGM